MNSVSTNELGKLYLDTSVYIANFRTGRFTQRIAESPFLFRGVSVVIH